MIMDVWFLEVLPTCLIPLKKLSDSSSAEADGGVGGLLEQKPTVASAAARQQGTLYICN